MSTSTSIIDYRKLVTVLGVLFLCQSILASDQKVIVKRTDLATCLEKFDVKNDMIIRTEESRRLGAKFLDSADVGTQVECLHLCCETSDCDVFVFEGKGQGACFLFHCGPAQNFRCKFTKHANYTSAVFSIDKKVSHPTVTTIKANHPVTLSPNELELKSLKAKPSDVSNGKTLLNSPTTSTTTQKAISESKNKTSPCSRFQFQCHSGDCIAVYNACDGIPQCDDGSDEGPECQSITRSPDTSLNKSSGVGRVQLIGTNTQLNPNGFIGHNREDPLTAPQWPNLVQPQSEQTQSRQISSFQDRQQQIPMNGYAWNNVADLNWPQQMPQFPIKPLDAFQTKQLPNAMQPDLAMAGQTQMQANQQQLNSWPMTALNLPNIQNVPVPNYPNHNHINEEVLPEKANADVIRDVPVADRKKDGKNTLIPSKTDSTSSDDSDYSDETDETTTEAPKKKKKHRKVNKVDRMKEDDESKAKDSVNHQMKMIHSGLQAEFLDHDGEADRPGGAVVSLALGILIVIGLVMVISCRTTAVRKRIRRNGKGYAHDADFLVNGMYL